VLRPNFRSANWLKSSQLILSQKVKSPTVVYTTTQIINCEFIWRQSTG